MKQNFLYKPSEDKPEINNKPYNPSEPEEKMLFPEFLDRITNPDKYPYITNEDGSISTHRMAAEVDENGNWFVFPTIVLMPDGTLKEFEDNAEALDYNLSIGNFLPMKNKNEAIKYAEGGYKKGTPLETFNPLQIENLLSNPLMEDTTK